MQAPIVLKTLFNMCAWSDGEPTPQQMESIVGSLLLEAQHHGRQFYGKIEQWVREERFRLNVMWVVPSYDAMVKSRISEYACAQALETSPAETLNWPLLARESCDRFTRCSVGVPRNELPFCFFRKKKAPQGSVSIFWVLKGTTETQRGTVIGEQANVEQSLTAPAETSLFQTPTMSFGEVGMTHETMMPSYAAKAHGVGHFEDTKILERMRLLDTVNWTTTSSGIFATLNVFEELTAISQNLAVLNQFNFIRAGVEVTVRINTNPLYYGALMFTLYPSDSVANRVDENAVLDPTIISASCGESVVKTWKYSYPDAWLDIGKLSNSYGSVWLEGHVLAPLTATNSTAPNSVEVQIWARFIDVVLSYPTPGQSLKEKDEVQSSCVKIFKKKGSMHPIDEAEDSVKLVVDALKSVTIGDAISEAVDLTRDLFPAIGYILDKPDDLRVQQPVITEPSYDIFQADKEDVGVSYGLYKGRYVDPAASRLPSSKNFTISDYARIPGLRGPVVTWAAATAPVEILPIQSHPDGTTYAIPLDYAWLASLQWRGSVKVCLMFFTSAFISARFAVQYINKIETTDAYSTVYDQGLSRVINVKGDTIDTFTLPWLSRFWWSENALPAFQVSLVSTIATTDTVNAPKIHMLCWVAGGDDIQFAFPNVVSPANWDGTATFKDRAPCAVKARTTWATATGDEAQSLDGKFTGFGETPEASYMWKCAACQGIGCASCHNRGYFKLAYDLFEWHSENYPESDDEDEVQSQIAEIFTKSFPPIGENSMYDIDNGLCTSESLGPITDIMKRYSPVPIKVSGTLPGYVRLDGNDLDYFPTGTLPVATNQYTQYVSMRQTLWGTWRAAFWANAGGMRLRYWDSANLGSFWFPTIGNSSNSTFSSMYIEPPDKVARLTIPAVMTTPFCVLNTATHYSRMGAAPSITIAPNVSSTLMIAARDDVQIGFPILPARFVAQTAFSSEVSKNKTNKLMSSLHRHKGD